MKKNISKTGPYLLGFLLLAFYCCVEYGPVIRHLAEENYFSFEELPMTYVLSQPYGRIYWLGRFLMLPFHNQWLGGLYLAVLFTLSAWLLDRAFGFCKALRGISFLAPAVILFWAAGRDYNLFMRNEPSLLIIWTYALLIVAAMTALIMLVVRKFMAKAKAKAEQKNEAEPEEKKQSEGQSVEHPAKLSVKRSAQVKKPAPAVVKPARKKVNWRSLPYGMLLGTLVLCAVGCNTYMNHKNLLLSCRMQNMMLEEEWVEMADLPLGELNVDRSVAAYHVIAVTRLNSTLERAFEINYEYPKVELDSIGGMDEGVNYIAECNLHAGLIQPAYHYALEQTVMSGPRVRYYKIMAIASMLNGEATLCEKILHVIDKMPFQHEFVERVREKLGNVEAQREDPTLGGILKLAPLENRFEQNYRQPMFLGYSVGVMEGTDATLDVSVAAALYSKDMENIILRSEYLQQKRPLPNVVQQALVLASLRRPGLLERFPGITDFVKNEVNSFLTDARAYNQDKSDEGKAKMAKALFDKWIGSYMYYYYCGNLNQTVKKKEETSVN